MGMNKKNSVLHQFVNLASGSLITMIIGFFTTPILTNLVNPDDYGKLSIFTVYLNVAVLILCIGLDQALVRFYYVKDTTSYKSGLLKKCSRLPLWATAAVGILFSVLCMAGMIRFKFGKIIAVCLSGCVFFDVLTRFSSLAVRLEYKSKTYSLLKIIRKASYVVLVIPAVFLFQEHQFLMLAVCTLAAAACEALFGIFFERKLWFGKPDRDTPETKVLVRYASPFILSMGLTTVFQAIDKFVLERYSTYAELGVYSAAMSLIHVFAILQSTVNTMWAPMATEHYEKAPEDKTFFAKANAYVTILMFFVGLCLILVKDVFALLLGEKYRLAAYILPCLCLNPIMYTLSETTVNGINFAKKSHYHILVGAVSCVVCFAGNMLLVPIFGGRGSAISAGLSYIVFFALRTYFSYKCYPVHFGVGKIAILTAAVFAYALYNTFVPFGIFTVLGFVGCVALLVLLYRSDIVSGVQALLSMLTKKSSLSKEERHDL